MWKCFPLPAQFSFFHITKLVCYTTRDTLFEVVIKYHILSDVMSIIYAVNFLTKYEVSRECSVAFCRSTLRLCSGCYTQHLLLLIGWCMYVGILVVYL
jgi:hypothetical protein